MKYRVVIDQDEDGIFVAECPSLPGCVSQGKTRAEALVNIKDAIEGYLASLAVAKRNPPAGRMVLRRADAPSDHRGSSRGLSVTRLPVISGEEVTRVFARLGYERDHQTGSHIILRHVAPPYRRLTVPNHRE